MKRKYFIINPEGEDFDKILKLYPSSSVGLLSSSNPIIFILPISHFKKIKNNYISDKNTILYHYPDNYRLNNFKKDWEEHILDIADLKMFQY